MLAGIPWLPENTGDTETEKKSPTNWKVSERRGAINRPEE